MIVRINLTIELCIHCNTPVEITILGKLAAGKGIEYSTEPSNLM